LADLFKRSYGKSHIDYICPNLWGVLEVVYCSSYYSDTVTLVMFIVAWVTVAAVCMASVCGARTI